jgi:L-threonylcarbamoyladenylate synthase
MDPARDLVVDGGPCAIGVESTIVDCTATPPRVLRLGAISQEQIDAVLAGDVEGSVPAAVLADAEISEVRTPGTLESHYAPVAAVLLVEAGGFESFASGRESWPRTGLVAASEVVTPDGWTRLAAPVTAEEYARELYVALRRADELELAIVVAVLPDATGGPLALAVRDRLARAAYADGS